MAVTNGPMELSRWNYAWT